MCSVYFNYELNVFYMYAYLSTICHCVRLTSKSTRQLTYYIYSHQHIFVCMDILCGQQKEMVQL